MRRLTAEDYEVVGRLPFLEGLAPEVVERLTAQAWVQTYPRGTLLFTQDTPADRFFVILGGWVKLFRQRADGEQYVIAVFTRGESFAEAIVFDGSHYPVTAEVVDEAELVVVPGPPFVKEVRDDSDLAVKMLGNVARRLHYLMHQLENLQGIHTRHRVAMFLLQQSPDATGSATVHLPFDKSLIAARLGMKPETFSRALARLRKVGVVTNGSNVEVADLDALRRYCERATVD